MILLVAKRHEQEAIVPLLTAEGYQTAAVDCHDQVAHQVQFLRPTVVIVDCGIPESFDVLDALRRSPKSQSIATVMFSIDDQDLRQKSLLKGADAYVPKGSLDWVELLTEIRRFAGTPGVRANSLPHRTQE